LQSALSLRFLSRCAFLTDADWPSPEASRGLPEDGGRQRNVSFEWQMKRDPVRITVNDEGYVRTFPRKNSILAESEGYEPADFDRRIEISGESGGTVEIDENMLLEAMPDFIPFVPKD
jgi:hypothetical protein